MTAGPRTFYLIAVGGTAMAPLAGLLVERGERVLGSDLPLYPPMSERIAALGIQVRPGFDARNLPEGIDRVVVGNLASRENPELREALRRGLPVASMPETLHDELLAGRHPVVVAGTHGKTTTTALIAWLLHAAGREPGFLIGGEPVNFPSPSAVGRGPAFVVEGDEYSTSWADKGPKFLHYAPRTLVITSIEFDHADLYADLSEVKTAFRKVVALVPAGGTIVANGDDPNVLDVLQGARARVVLYRVHESGRAPGDEGPDAELEALSVIQDEAGTRLSVRDNGRPPFVVTSPLAGLHNASNVLAALAAAQVFGLTHEELTRGVAGFAGVRRRLELRGEAAGVTVIDDFAHHPTAVATTLDGARRRFAGRRLWAVFEPRSFTACRADFAEAYRRALARADGVALATAHHAARLSGNGGPGALDVNALAASLREGGREAFAAPDATTIVSELLPRLAGGDTVLVMSSGAFGGLCDKLLAALRERAQAAA